LEILIPGAVEFYPGADRPTDALPLEMDDSCGGDMKDRPTGGPHLSGPVRLLEEEKVTLIEHPHRIDGALADHHAGPDPRIDLDRTQVNPPLARKVPREKRLQERGVHHQTQKGREGPDGVLTSPVGVEELSAGHCRLRMGLQKGIQFPGRPFHQHCVRIEQEGVSPFHEPQPLIVGRPESPILVIRDDPHPGKPLAHHGHTAVGGSVVDDDNLVGKIPEGLIHGLQASAQEFSGVPVDDDDRYVHRTAPGHDPCRAGTFIHSSASARLQRAAPEEIPIRDSGCFTGFPCLSLWSPTGSSQRVWRI